MKTLYIFTFAPAGLGHLRVTKALVESRPKGCKFAVLGSKDEFITSVHRFTSINPIARDIFEKSQRGILESLFTTAYIHWLRANTKSVCDDLTREIRESEADKIVVIASHFGMAHQIAEIKGRLARECGKEIKLVVQVTDDTFQKAWAVKGADLIIVPSNYRMKQYREYMKYKGWSANFAVCPYPLSLRLTKKISESREQALKPGSDATINVMIPVSGAAVGLEFYTKVINKITEMSGRFRILVVSKKAGFTNSFVRQMRKNKFVEVFRGKNDKETVDIYEELYKRETIHIEITKPSEQAFKAMLPVDSVGGSILLLTEAVGRQEYENKEFLKRHGLMCSIKQEKLLESCKAGACETGCPPRVINLPSEPIAAAELIIQMLDHGCLAKMAKVCDHVGSLSDVDIRKAGVSEFWGAVERI